MIVTRAQIVRFILGHLAAALGGLLVILVLLAGLVSLAWVVSTW
jgi:uncharacterized membrane protein YccF (DUF307 family)